MKTRKLVIRIIALLLCVVPPAVTVLLNFPVWIDRSHAATISGTVLVLLVLCCIPFYKAILAYIKSAAAPVLWLLLFAFCYLFGAIVDELTIVAFVGMISNLLGALLFKLEKRYRG
jgi:hypothetical protein